MDNDFEKETFENEKVSNKEKLNNVLAYVPFLNVWMLFVDKQWETQQTKKFVRQWVTIFLLYIVLFIVASVIWLWFIATIAYVVWTIFFWAKAYNWIYVEVDFLEKIMEKFSPNKK